MHSHEVSREEQAALERRCAVLLGDGEGSRTALENSERARKALEAELQEAGEKSSDLNNQVGWSQSRLRHTEAKRRDRPSPPSAPVGSEWEEEAGGGPPDSAAGARGAAGGAERKRGKGEEGRR